MRYWIFSVIVAVMSVPCFSDTIHVPKDQPTIQAGIDAAKGGDTVLVAPGTYFENVHFKSYSVHLISKEGPVYTTIDGNRAGPVIVNQHNKDAFPTLEGFTITNGKASHGAGITCRHCSMHIKGNVITNNESEGEGAGIYVHGSGSVEDTIINGNTISNNTATSTGGGISIGSGVITIKRNMIFNNWAKIGGGISCNNSSLIVNNVIYGNFGSDGGGVALHHGSALLLSNTIANNHAGEGGGILVGENPTLVNCILWGNTANIGQQIRNKGSVVVEYSNVQGGWQGNSNINNDPIFVNPANNDYHILSGSPCIDAGTHHSLLGSTDFEGDPRIVAGLPDIGADEFHRHLYMTGDFVPSGAVDFKLIGEPWSKPAAFWFSADTLLVPLHSKLGDWYLKPPIFGPVDLGIMPTNGLWLLSSQLPAIPGPYSVAFQGIVGDGVTNAFLLNVE